jgi:N-methylhydantoinase B
MSRSNLDPVTFSVVWGGLLSAAAEMGVTLARTAYSMAVREGSDFSTGIFDAEGHMVAQGDYSPGHLGSMAFAVNLMLEDFPRETLRPGDAIICNDPWIGSGHLPDVYMVTPVFHEGRLIGFSVCIGHQIDVGGAGAGSTVIQGVIDNYQEGLRIPPTLCFREGLPVKEVFRIIEANVRVPEVLGDLRAQFTANTTGVARMQELAQQYGAEVLKLCMQEIIERSEAQMRAELRRLPEGTYTFEDNFDDAGPDTPPIKFKVAITIKDGEIALDWDGTGPQVEAGMNSTLHYTYAYSIAAVKSVTLPRSPQNHGVIRTIKVEAPLGSFLNPRRPAPCGGRNVVSHRIYETALGALSQAVPERVISASSHFFNPMVGGVDPRTDKPFILWEVIVGGIGARYAKDGIEATTSPYNTTNVPVELQELHNPCLVERVELIQDSAGAGRYRGGCALRKDLRLLADNTNFYNVGDRAKFAPYGLFGGGPGALGRTILNPSEENERELSSKGTYRLRLGDVISWRTSGAGGSGDPLERDIQQVLDDVLDGFVSVAAAAELYGVVVDQAAKAIDRAATEQLRARLQKAFHRQPANTQP